MRHQSDLVQLVSQLGLGFPLLHIQDAETCPKGWNQRLLRGDVSLGLGEVSALQSWEARADPGGGPGTGPQRVQNLAACGHPGGHGLA